ncbi:MAG: ABC transporter ATP-binding protein [Candidatus Bathyarchaeota archaeon]|nr:ABC transporter ATP-binding protein [Candidatus Bathyarchaeota archaeon]
MSIDNAIACHNLVKDYKGHKTVRALNDLSFSVPKGEVFGLLGPNGAGKTTLVKILTTLLRATSGSAEVGGYDVDREEDKVRQIIGYAGQDSERSAYFRLTVRENLLYFAHALRDVPAQTVRERMDHMATSIGFSDRLDKQFITLSGGEKQLVIVMRAIVHAPEICFLDEPSKSLDPVTARNVRNFLRSYADEHGITMCLTTHNMKEAEEFCDKIAFINHGRLQFIGTPSQFRRRVTLKEVIEVGLPRLEKAVESKLLEIPGVSNITYNGTTTLYCDDAFNILDQILAVLKGERIKAPVRMVEPSLEDAFAFFVRNGEAR